MGYTLEVCVDSVESAIEAKKGGADRLELCSNLLIGGTSPSVELFNIIKEEVGIKQNVLIRPRFGDFCYTDYEIEIIKREVKRFRELGANGIVIGVLLPDGNLDYEKMAVLKEMAKEMEVTLHRAFDVCIDPYKALIETEKLEIDTILTSGQKAKAIDAMDFIDKLQENTKVNIMAGSGINYDAVKVFIENTKVKSFHMSGKKTIDSDMIYRKEGVPMGLPLISEYDIWRTDGNEIKKVRELLK